MPSSLTSTVAELRSDADLIDAAQALAGQLRAGAIERDRAQTLPHAELEAIARSGLLALPVPAEHGGPGASYVTLARVYAILAAADPAFAQITQPHTSFLEIVRTNGTAEQRARYFGDALAGKRFGNALSERGTKHVFEYRTRLTREGASPGTRRLSGTKYYSTGAAGADWIGVLALDDDDLPVVAYVRGDAPGLAVAQDWTAFGQRSTISGTTVLEDVAVPEEDIVAFAEGSSTTGAHAQLVHAAIDLGIARGALDDGIDFVRTRARPYPGSGLERVADEDSVKQHYGRLAVRVDAAAALLDAAAAKLDTAAADESEATILAARLAIAGAKAFAGDVALEAATGLFEGAGASAVDAARGLDRHWRNARTHTLHDPNRWKYIHLGDWLLNDTPPAAANHLV